MSSWHEVAVVNRPIVGAPASTAESSLEFRSTPYLRALRQIELYARAQGISILLEGESGTGKTRLARYIHRLSPRASGPFETVDLGALDDGVASSELFGHTAGAFTDARRNRAGLFVSASGGTLFLDEIGKASLAVQRKLLRAIELGEVRPVGADRGVRVDARVIVASNIPIGRLVEQDKFLPDLCARLEVFRVTLPPLRERRADIPILVSHYVELHAPHCGYRVAPQVDSDLMFALQRAPWPNNLRQLDSTIHRMLIHAEGAPRLSRELCADDLEYLNQYGKPKEPTLRIDSVEQAVEIAGSVAGAARLLGRHRSTIYRERQRRGPITTEQAEHNVPSEDESTAATRSDKAIE